MSVCLYEGTFLCLYVCVFVCLYEGTFRRRGNKLLECIRLGLEECQIQRRIFGFESYRHPCRSVQAPTLNLDPKPYTSDHTT